MATSRREKLREATREEIKQVALQQMAEQGSANLSLRAIAAQMGLSASALYNYFANRDELVTALILDAYNSLAEAAEQGSQSYPQTQYGERFLAATMAFHDWAVAHPNEFALIFGTPIPGYHAPAEITTPAAVRAFAPFNQILKEAWRNEQVTIPPEYAGLDLPVLQTLMEVNRERGLIMPLPLLHLTMVGWGLITGLSSLEIYGQFDFVGGNITDIYRAEIIAFLKRLKLL